MKISPTYSTLNLLNLQSDSTIAFIPTKSQFLTKEDVEINHTMTAFS